VTFSNDTIAAVATPFGQGAVSLLRLSGPKAREVFARCWRGRALYDPRRAALGKIVRPVPDGSATVVDEGLAIFFPGPASYTGEDVVEFTGHGGVLVTRRVLDALLAAGARLAEPGEFTQRAFLQGKLDLTQAEAVMDLISAQTDLALQAAQEQLAGRLGASIESLREDILGLLAHVEAYIDFPEEDIDPDTGSALRVRMETARTAVDRLLATADQGRILREGVRTVIVGAPNVGKSSLLNRLLGFDRAIVSDIAGTTRDTLEEVINLRGLPLRLVDTAGLRESSDALEQAGIERSHAALSRAELVLEVADGTQPCDRFQSAAPIEKPRVLVLNKADLEEHPSWLGVEAVRVSCTTGAGLETLAKAIETLLTGGTVTGTSDLIAINARHQACLQRARAGLDAAHTLLAAAQPPELVAEELRAALQAVGEVVGEADPEELLGVIFSRFCIGK
jgi:tRNA modification GTPase